MCVRRISGTVSCVIACKQSDEYMILMMSYIRLFRSHDCNSSSRSNEIVNIGATADALVSTDFTTITLVFCQCSHCRHDSNSYSSILSISHISDVRDAIEGCPGEEPLITQEFSSISSSLTTDITELAQFSVKTVSFAE